jgi:hypothetical protein
MSIGPGGGQSIGPGGGLLNLGIQILFVFNLENVFKQVVQLPDASFIEI